MARPGAGFDAGSHERHHWWRSLLLRGLVCAALTAGMYRAWGWLGVLVTLMLWARVFAADLLSLGTLLFRALRQLAFRPVQGRFYQFKGHRVRVVDDAVQAQRWIALDDLATALGRPLPAAVFRRLQALRELDDGAYVLDEAVLDWLRAQRSDRAGRLALWLEREVWYPARGRKASYKKNGAAQAAPFED